MPGEEAQYRMAHAARYRQGPPPPDARDAGVLMLLYPHGGEAHTVLIRRGGDHPDDRHKGQIGFPGGKREEEDTDLSASALREAEEEVGVPRHAVRMLRPLTPLYIPVSNFLVHPFLGVVEERPEFVPQPEEVAGILEVPLRHFLDPACRRSADIPIGRGTVLRQVPCFDLDGLPLWGATAMILNEFLAWWQEPAPRP